MRVSNGDRVQPYMHDLRDAFVFARCENIERYRRMLRTPLTFSEREFIERRLSEEKRALLEGIQSARQPS